MNPTPEDRRRQGIWWMALFVSFMVVGFAIAMLLASRVDWRGHEPAPAPTATTR